MAPSTEGSAGAVEPTAATFEATARRSTAYRTAVKPSASSMEAATSAAMKAATTSAPGVTSTAPMLSEC